MAIKSTIKRKVCSLYWMNDLYGGSETKVSQEGSVRGRGGRWHCVSSSYYEWVMSVSVSKQSLAGVYDSDVPWGHHPCSSWLLLIESISNGFWQNTLEEEPKNVTPGLKKKKKKDRLHHYSNGVCFLFFSLTTKTNWCALQWVCSTLFRVYMYVYLVKLQYWQTLTICFNNSANLFGPFS